MSYKVSVYHLYPDAMNLYGDYGNILSIKNRCEWRGLDFEYVEVKLGDAVRLQDADILFMGGGQDRGQRIIGQDLVKRGPEIKDRIDEGMAALTICGGFQLFGKYFKTKDGDEIPGINVFDAYTVGGDKRIIGNVVVDIAKTSTGWTEKYKFKAIETPHATLVGFENHSGLTKLGPNSEPLGYVAIGGGNMGDGGYEGAIYNNAYGTYLHGSLLPKNPHFTDHLIAVSLLTRYGSPIPLEPLSDNLEWLAHNAALERAKTAKTLSI
jgi:CobQ-like glutamine amidotransferase family enzyme